MVRGSKTTLPKAPPPRDAGKGWDWGKRYWDVGDLVTVRADHEPRIRHDREGKVTGFTLNRFGRMAYHVQFGPRNVLKAVMLEALIPRLPPDAGQGDGQDEEVTPR
jgi:hypothetical protein